MLVGRRLATGALRSAVDAAVGAMAGETRIRQVLAGAGYTRVRRVARDAAPFNIVLEARP
jgi:hypothetical protein